MSAAFTTPIEQSWQTLLTELTLAYSERRQAISQSAYTPTAGKNVHSAAYWAGLQAWLESYCTSFIDHVSGPLNAGGTDFLYFTLAAWRSAAGLNASGFRRSTDHGASFSYGNMAQGDYIDSWIFEDLQKGFGALKWSGLTGADYSLTDGYTKSGYSQWETDDTEEGYALAVAMFNAAEWQSTPGVKNFAGIRLDSVAFPGNILLSKARNKFSIGVSAPCLRSADVYTKEAVYGYAEPTPPENFWPHGDFNTGVPASMSLKKVLTISETLDNPIMVDYISGDGPPELHYISGAGFAWYGYIMSTIKWVVKYNFTNA